VRAQELVGAGQLGAGPGRLAARGFRGLLGLPARPAGAVRGGVGLPQLVPAAAGLLRERLHAGEGGRLLGAERRELALQGALAVGVEPLELRLQDLDALPAVLVGLVLGGLRAQDPELALAAVDPLGERPDRLPGALQAQLDPLGRRPRDRGPADERLSVLGPARERLLGGLAAGGDRAQAGVGLVPREAGGLGRRGRGGQRGPARPGGVPRELPARLHGLALDPLVELCGLGLALERPQPRARLALHVERPVQVVLRALELELRAAAALAVLAQARGLLDEQAAVLRLGGDDGLHAALGDHGVHLLAQARVAQELQDVHEPAARAVEPVLALARAVQPADDGDLAERDVDPAVALSRTISTSAEPRACTPRPPPKMTSCMDWPRTGERALLAHRPQDGVRDVRLARAVRARRSPTRRARTRASCGRGKDLKPLREMDRRCISRRPPRRSDRSRATARGLLLGGLLRAPVPSPRTMSPMRATTVKTRSCGGRTPPVTTYATTCARWARRSCSEDLKSTGCSSASSISGREGLHHRRLPWRRSPRAGSRPR
jgi:hypothetical protein